jgi:hypothetical protein
MTNIPAIAATGHPVTALPNPADALRAVRCEAATRPLDSSESSHLSYEHGDPVTALEGRTK